MKTKTEAKPMHTPVPWHLEKNNHVPNIGIYKDITESGAVHPTWEVIAFLDDDMEKAQANAEFIVRAVNSHKQLLADNKSLMDEIGKLAKEKVVIRESNEALLEAAKAALEFVESRSSTTSDDWIGVWKLLVDAIKQAEGKS
jgi:ElaB/YqjD/DUF883 family membrane-anchored ribosome-binding protein